MATEEYELMTVQSAHALYDLQELELWTVYAENPTYPAGLTYMRAERLMRQRAEQAVRSIRRKLADERWKASRAES